MSRKTTSEPDAYDLSTEVALFRYGLIAQLIHDPPPKGQQEAQLRALAAKTYQRPASSRNSGKPTGACRVSLSALRRYLKAYRAGGFDALRPAGRPDAGSPRAFPPDVLAKAIALRAEQPARTTQTLVDLLQRDPELQLAKPLNAHTLTTHLRRRGQTRRLLRQDSRTYRRFERAQVNELWQGDGLVGPWLPDPHAPGKKRRTHLFCFIDDHSRLVPYAEFFFDEALPRMERVLKVAILRRGLPRAIYVDNGQVYSASQFAAACATLGVHRIQATPYAPEGRGKQERFFETLRLQFLPEVETSDITTLSALNESLWAWLECIYHQRVHSETEQTPLARYSAGLAQVRSVDPETTRSGGLAGVAALFSGARNARSSAMQPSRCRATVTRSIRAGPAARSNCASIRSTSATSSCCSRVKPSVWPRSSASKDNFTWPLSAWRPNRLTRPSRSRHSTSWPSYALSTARNNNSGASNLHV